MSSLQGFGPIEYTPTVGKSKESKQPGHNFNPAQFGKVLEGIGGEGAVVAEGAAAGEGLGALASLLVL